MEGWAVKKKEGYEPNFWVRLGLRNGGEAGAGRVSEGRIK